MSFSDFGAAISDDPYQKKKRTFSPIVVSMKVFFFSLKVINTFQPMLLTIQIK